MKNYKDKFDKKVKETFGKEKSGKVFQTGYTKIYDRLAAVPIWKKLLDIAVNVLFWFFAVKIFNHIDPIDEGLYKGSNNLIYLAKSFPLTLAFYPIGAALTHCILDLDYESCMRKFGAWPKFFLFTMFWIGVIAEMDANAPRAVYYPFICLPVMIQFWPEIVSLKRVIFGVADKRKGKDSASEKLTKQ